MAKDYLVNTQTIEKKMEFKFGTTINCIDGRTQKPVSEWIKENFQVDVVDTVTEPGCDKIMPENDLEKIEQIKSKVMISINKHKSSVVVIAGHHDCAGNPVSKEEHIEQIKQSAEKIKSWNLPVKVAGLWINDKWEAEQISD